MTGKLRKMHEKNTYLGSIFIPEKYVIYAFCESMDEPDTPSCHLSAPGIMSSLEVGRVRIKLAVSLYTMLQACPFKNDPQPVLLSLMVT